jgi:hypothetical protein
VVAAGPQPFGYRLEELAPAEQVATTTEDPLFVYSPIAAGVRWSSRKSITDTLTRAGIGRIVDFEIEISDLICGERTDIPDTVKQT